jgi:hypothetical protein
MEAVGISANAKQNARKVYEQTTNRAGENRKHKDHEMGRRTHHFQRASRKVSEDDPGTDEKSQVSGWDKTFCDMIQTELVCGQQL